MVRIKSNCRPHTVYKCCNRTTLDLNPQSQSIKACVSTSCATEQHTQVLPGVTAPQSPTDAQQQEQKPQEQYG